MQQQVISSIFGWISVVLLCLLLAVKPLGRLEKNHFMVKTLNKVLKQYHIFRGIVLLIIVFIHGKTILNKDGLVTGIISFLVLFFLLILSPMRKILKRYWLPTHRILSLILFIIVMIHIIVATT